MTTEDSDSTAISREPWGTVDGKPADLFTLRNRRGTLLTVTNYGATLTGLHLRDRDGKVDDVLLGFDTLDGYLGDHPYFGCIAGRCANRIAHGRFELDGVTIDLARNHGEHHLHGGNRGFGRHVWDARPELSEDGPALQLTRVSPDGEEGYPGRLDVSVTYTLTHDDVLRVGMSATTDAPTVVNLVQHAYWNLAGGGPVKGSVEQHRLRMHAERYVPVDEGLIPLGRFEDVAGTPFDFRTPVAIGARLRGYDHDFVIVGEPSSFRPVCGVVDPASGRRMTLWADQPGCQLYTAHSFDGTIVGKGGRAYEAFAGLCLETQHHPDSVHQPQWPSAVLRPGGRYVHGMEYRFDVLEE